MKQTPTFEAKIFIGLGTPDHEYLLEQVQDVCQEYVDSVGLCVTVTPTQYVYTGGTERGAIVGLINYPRFPDLLGVRDKALKLAALLKGRFRQQRVSVMFHDETVMLENV